MLFVVGRIEGALAFPESRSITCAPPNVLLSGHLLSEFAGDGTVGAHLLLEDGVGLVVVGSSGLAAGLPLCQCPQLAGEVEIGDCCLCHSVIVFGSRCKDMNLFSSGNG